MPDSILNIVQMMNCQDDQQRLWYEKEQLTDSERDAIIDELIHGLHEEVGELARLARRKKFTVRFGRRSMSVVKTSERRRAGCESSNSPTKRPPFPEIS